MKMQLYLLNRTYIAEDRTTGLMATSTSEKEAKEKLTALVSEYWEKKKVVVPIKKETKEL